MAYDVKYGRVTLEHGEIGEDEPVVVLRARDSLVTKLLAYYRLFAWKAGSSQSHLEQIDQAIVAVENWQKTHDTRVPD